MYPVASRGAVLLSLSLLLPVAAAAQPAAVTSPPDGAASVLAAPPAAAPAASPAPAASASVTTAKVTGVLGGHVFSGDKDVGRIIEVLVDADGKPRAAVVDFGGFLGIGSRKIAVDWVNMHFPAPGDDAGKITVDLTADNMRTAPEWKSPDQPVAIVGAQSPASDAPAPAAQTAPQSPPPATDGSGVPPASSHPAAVEHAP